MSGVNRVPFTEMKAPEGGGDAKLGLGNVNLSRNSLSRVYELKLWSFRQSRSLFLNFPRGEITLLVSTPKVSSRTSPGVCQGPGSRIVGWASAPLWQLLEIIDVSVHCCKWLVKPWDLCMYYLYLCLCLWGILSVLLWTK